MRFIYTKAFAIFSACLVMAVVLAGLQYKGWLDPIRSAMLRAPRPVMLLAQNVVVPVRDFFGTIYQLKKISQENVELQSQVIQLQQELVEENQLQLENEALRKELGFAKNTSFNLAPCTVLSQNPFGSSGALILNCGLGDGVAEGDAVISQGYLVGKVVYAGDKSCTVLLATSPNFSTDARISQTNATAIVSGSFGSGLIVDQVPQDTDLQTGWLAVSAGINPQIPKNLLIGQIGSILSTNNDLFKRAALISPIDFNNLQFVFVVKS